MVKPAEFTCTLKSTCVGFQCRRYSGILRVVYCIQTKNVLCGFGKIIHIDSRNNIFLFLGIDFNSNMEITIRIVSLTSYIAMKSNDSNKNIPFVFLVLLNPYKKKQHTVFNIKTKTFRKLKNKILNEKKKQFSFQAIDQKLIINIVTAKSFRYL